MLNITEIYASVQGESFWDALHICEAERVPTQLPVVRYRLFFQDGEEMSLEGVLEKVQNLNIHVELTGGEPLAQQNSIPLLKALIREGYKVLIETSGAHCISSVPRDVSIIMDLKCPDSKMCERNLWSNLEHLKPEDEIKFVVASREDFEWALQVTRQRDLEQKFKLLFSPAWGLVDPKDLVSWLLESRVQARLNLQLHKYIWSPKTKGV